MKKALYLVSCLLISGITVFATQTSTGSTVISGINMFYASATSKCLPQFNISNITNSTITVQITFYANDGTMLTDASSNAGAGIIRCATSDITNYDESTTDYSCSFDLGANCTTQVWINNTTASITEGYGRIQWSQESNVINGLVASGNCEYTYASGARCSWAIIINNGMPF